MTEPAWKSFLCGAAILALAPLLAAALTPIAVAGLLGYGGWADRQFARIVHLIP